MTPETLPPNASRDNLRTLVRELLMRHADKKRNTVHIGPDLIEDITTVLIKMVRAGTNLAAGTPIHE